MCGRFVATSPVSALAEQFLVDEIKVEGEPDPRYNVAPTLDVIAVAESRSGDGARRLGAFRWGLVPSWAKDISIGSKLINARAESLHEKPAFRKALARRRCIIPADAFYEWRRPPEGSKAKKQPFIIHRSDGVPMAFAGLWEAWRDPSDPEDQWLRTCAIITTAANATVRPLHDRMPVILPPAAWDQWLDTGIEDGDAVRGLLVPCPADDLATYPVSTLVNDVRNDGPELARPVEAGLPL